MPQIRGVTLFELFDYVLSVFETLANEASQSQHPLLVDGDLLGALRDNRSQLVSARAGDIGRHSSSTRAAPCCTSVLQTIRRTSRPFDKCSMLLVFSICRSSDSRNRTTTVRLRPGSAGAWCRTTTSVGSSRLRRLSQRKTNLRTHDDIVMSFANDKRSSASISSWRKRTEIPWLTGSRRGRGDSTCAIVLQRDEESK